VTKLYNDFCEIISCEMNDKLKAQNCYH
jgi:hypothetical protein